MPDHGWSTPFEDPIPLARGRQLVTLKDAADYITRLPKADDSGGIRFLAKGRSAEEQQT
jgi:hypothetical protein